MANSKPKEQSSGFRVNVADGLVGLVTLATSRSDEDFLIGKVTMPQPRSEESPAYLIDEIDVVLSPYSDGNGFGQTGYRITASIIPPSGQRLAGLNVQPDKAFPGFEFYKSLHSTDFWLRSPAIGGAYPVYVSFQDIDNFMGIQVWHVVHAIQMLTGNDSSVGDDLLAFAESLERTVNVVYESAKQQAPEVTLRLEDSGILSKPNPKAAMLDYNPHVIRSIVQGFSYD